MTFRLVLLPSTPSVAPPASANPQVKHGFECGRAASAAGAAGTKPQVDEALQARTLASFRCEGSFVFRNVFSVGFLGLAYKTVQLSRASLKNCHVSSQDNRITGLNV